MKRTHASCMAIQKLLAAGRAHFDGKEFEKARQCFEQVLGHDGGNGETLFEMGKVLRALGKHREALEMFSNAEREMFRGHGIDKEIGELCYIVGKSKEAQERFERIVRHGGNDTWAMFRLGCVYAADGERERAIKMFTKAARGKRGLYEARYELARIYLGQNDLFRAARELKRLNRQKSDDIWVLKTLAFLYRENKEQRKAGRLFETILMLDPKDEEARTQLVGLYQEFGDSSLSKNNYTRAMTEYGRALKQRSDDMSIRTKIEEVREMREKARLARKMERRCGGGRTERRGLLEFYRFVTDCAHNIAGRKRDDAIVDYRERLRGITQKGRQENDAALMARIKIFNRVARDGDPGLDGLQAAISGDVDGDDAFLKNKALNEIEILQGKLILQSKPTNMRITLTNRCNLRCTMCYLRKEKAWDVPDAVMREMSGYIPCLEQIIWQGGEAFLSKHFEDLFMKASKSARLRQVVITNGLMIDERWADRFASAGNVELRISIDGVTKQTYENIRRGGNFDRLIGTLRLLNDRKAQHHSGLEMNMNFVVTKTNYHEIEKALEFAAAHRFRNIVFVPVVNPAHDDGNIYYQHDHMIVSNLASLYPRLQMKADEYGLGLDYRVIECNSESQFGQEEHGNRDASSQWPAQMPFCRVPWQSMFIGENNDFAPECICPIFSKQDAPGVTLEQIWNGQFMQEYRSKMLRNQTEWCNQQCVSGIFPPQNREMKRL